MTIGKEDTAGSATLVSLLKVCAERKDLYRGSVLHANIVEGGLLQNNTHVGSTLVNMYSKCGALEKAQEVFDELPCRNVVSWNALITGYTQHGHGQEAVNCFEQMQQEGFQPNAVTFVCILKACGSIGAIDKGGEVHAEIAKEGLLGKNVLVGNALVDMYGKCGAFAKARQVFNELSVRNVVSWNTVIAGYVQNGHGEEALTCFEQMQYEGVSPNAVTFVCILKACGNTGAADKGQEIHAQLISEALLEKNLSIGNALVDMYAKFGALSKAQEVFDKLQIRDIVTWSALIWGYAQHGDCEEAINCFVLMRSHGITLDAVGFICILKACGSIGAVDKGQEIHAEISREGLLTKNLLVGTALVDMYAKSGALAKAKEVFDELPVQNVVSWSVLMAGYTQHGHGEEALSCFEQMQRKGLSPDAVTFVCILKACILIGAADKGQEIHAEVARVGLLDKSSLVGNAIVDMYVKCGALAKAQEVFRELPLRNVVTWSTLIAGCAQQGYGEEALNYFEEMQGEGLSPSVLTYVCILKACGSIGAADRGQQIHGEIVKEGLLGKDNLVGTALIDMYAKCGAFAKAQLVFDELPVRDAVTWSALMAAYSQIGKDDVVFDTFLKMIREGIQPDLVTFTIALNTCSNSGLLDKGQMCFETMTTGYGIIPSLEHHTCMVDLFSRAGLLDRVVAVIRRMPYFADLTVWHTVLGACQKWKDMKLGKLAFDYAVQLDEKDATAYVCMSNIYAAAGMQEDVHMIEAMRRRMEQVRTLY